MQILGTRKTRTTGQKLAERLDANYIEGRPHRDDITIRYGNGYSVDPEGIVINKRDAIRNCVNKIRCKEILMQNNINTPKLYTFQEASNLLRNSDSQVVVRKNGHSQGRWFYLVNNVRQLSRYDSNSHYCQELVNKIDEYRLFIMKDRIIEANLKVPPENDPHSMIRNHTHGSTFRIAPVRNLNQTMKDQARKATELLGLDFAAIDCATTRLSDGTIKPTIFEVNTGPSLTVDRKLDLFVAKLHQLCNI